MAAIGPLGFVYGYTMIAVTTEQRQYIIIIYAFYNFKISIHFKFQSK